MYVTQSLSLWRYPKFDSLSAPDSTEGTSDSDDVDHKLDPSSVDFGSCVAAITVNDRLLVIRTQHRSVDMCTYICTCTCTCTLVVHDYTPPCTCTCTCTYTCTCTCMYWYM